MHIEQETVDARIFQNSLSEAEGDGIHGSDKTNHDVDVGTIGAMTIGGVIEDMGCKCAKPLCARFKRLAARAAGPYVWDKQKW